MKVQVVRSLTYMTRKLEAGDVFELPDGSRRDRQIATALLAGKKIRKVRAVPAPATPAWAVKESTPPPPAPPVVAAPAPPPSFPRGKTIADKDDDDEEAS